MKFEKNSFGIYIPSNKNLRPSYSKSAPCKCCGPTESTCAACTPLLPSTLTLHDPYYGATVTLTLSAGIWVGTNTTINITNGATNNGGVCGPSGSVTTSLKYNLVCSSNKLGILINQYQCFSGVPADNSIPSLIFASAGLTVTQWNLATNPIDCSSPNFTNGVSPGSTIYFYQSSTTLTITA